MCFAYVVETLTIVIPKKVKVLFMAFCSVYEEWFLQKCVKVKRESSQKLEMSFIHICLTITKNMLFTC